MLLTSDDLETEVRQRVRLPSATDILTAEILRHADRAMAGRISDVIRNVSPSFWSALKTHTLVSGQATYEIPRRAIGAGVERVELQDSAGAREPVNVIDAADAWRYASGGRDPYWEGRFACYLDGESVTLVPTPTSATAGLTLRVLYQREPSLIDDIDNCARIERATTTTALNVQASVTALVLADRSLYVDIVRGDGVHEVLYADSILTAYSGNDMTLSASTPVVVANIADRTTVTGGRADYVARAGYSPFPQIPATCWPLLVCTTAMSLCASIGDRAGYEEAKADALGHEADARTVLTPRSRSLPRMVNHNSYLRRGRGWR